MYRRKYHCPAPRWVGLSSATIRAVEAFGEALDRATLARRVAALEQHDQPGPGLLGPPLQLQQFDLQHSFRALALATAQLVVVRPIVAPGLDDVPGHPAA